MEIYYGKHGGASSGYDRCKTTSEFSSDCSFALPLRFEKGREMERSRRKNLVGWKVFVRGCGVKSCLVGMSMKGVVIGILFFNLI